MKKQVILSTTLAAAILGGTALIALGQNQIASAEEKYGDGALIAANNTLSSSNQISTASDETVYVIANADGSTKTRFVGSTLYTGKSDLPFTSKITYYLDGTEISAEDLAGKSGHVKIVYNYSSSAQYLGKYVPFLAVTGVTLDRTVFDNVSVASGKIISETEGNYAIAGYSLMGLDANLGTDFLSSSFTLEADVKDFKLGNTYTVVMNDLFSDIDTSKLSSIDELTNSVSQLASGLDQIISGAGSLTDGLTSALDGAKTLYAGSQDLAAGAEELSAGAATLSTGANSLATEGTPALQAGADAIITKIIDKLNASLAGQGVPAITRDNYALVLGQVIDNINTEKIPSVNNAISYYCGTAPDITECAKYQVTLATLNSNVSSLTQNQELLDGLLRLEAGIYDYTGHVSEIADGSQALSAGANELSAGAAELSSGLSSLVDGTTQLYNGSVTLKDGLNTFKTTGIDKLVSFASGDLQNFTANLRSTINAASSYHSFSNTSAKSVKFIIKTPSI